MIDRVVYMAHPVSGDVEGNLRRAKQWLRWYEEQNPTSAVVANWITECEVWDDSNPAHRAAGLERDIAVLKRCDAIVLVGGRVSSGMAGEVAIAEKHGLEIEDLTHLGEVAPWAN